MIFSGDFVTKMALILEKDNSQLFNASVAKYKKYEFKLELGFLSNEKLICHTHILNNTCSVTKLQNYVKNYHKEVVVNVIKMLYGVKILTSLRILYNMYKFLIDIDYVNIKVFKNIILNNLNSIDYKFGNEINIILEISEDLDFDSHEVFEKCNYSILKRLINITDDVFMLRCISESILRKRYEEINVLSKNLDTLSNNVKTIENNNMFIEDSSLFPTLE